jgi:GntR family transcriptional regulator, galactonate operon transcriptional repressor
MKVRPDTTVARQLGSARPGSLSSAGGLRGLHGQTVELLGSRIVQGVYSPGTALLPEELEGELGISKSVLREALRVLAAKGLVVSRQKRGTIVRSRSDWNLLDESLLRWLGEPDDAFIEDINEVRKIVEPAVAELAAERRTDGDLDDLENALAGMEKAGSDAAAVIQADLLFHRLLLFAAHNELLSRMEVVIEAGLRVRDEVVHRGKSWPDATPGHRAVYEAVRAGDAAGARSAMDSLLEQATSDFRVKRSGRRLANTPQDHAAPVRGNGRKRSS